MDKNKFKKTPILPRDITATQAADLVEHTLRDDGPVPGTSGNRRQTSAPKKDVKKKESTPASKTQTKSTVAHEKKTSESNRSEHPRRKRNEPTLPPKGKPGGLDDPLRRGLSGAGVRWYLRFLAQGKTPEEAREGALARRKQAQDASAPSESKSRKRGREQHTPPQGNAAKRKRGPELHHSYSGRRATSYAAALTCVKVAVLPEEYPAVHLSKTEQSAVEEILVDKISEGWEGGALQFEGIHFKPGMLVIDCLNEDTAQWLLSIVPMIQDWTGPKLAAKKGVDIPKQHVITVFIPRSSGQSTDKTLSLLKAQNQGIYVDQWKILSVREEGNGQLMTFCIDTESKETIIKGEHTLRYRFGTVPVTGLGQKKDTSDQVEPTVDKPTAPESMNVDSSHPASQSENKEEGENQDIDLTALSLEEVMDEDFVDDVGAAQVNIHHAKAASAVIARVFAKQHLGLALIQEPWCYKGGIRGLNCKDTTILWDHSQVSPRACIMVRKDIKYFLLSEYLSRDVVAANITLTIGGTHCDIVVASAYFPGDGDAPPRQVTQLVEHCKKIGRPLIIGCDANAHNELWGSTDTNKRGEYLLEYLIKEDLEIFNVGTAPTFVTRARKEVLDITFGCVKAKTLVKDWMVSDEPSMSDHRIIMFKVDGAPEVCTPGRNIRKTNWGKYAEALGENLVSVSVTRVPRHPLELETALKESTSAILDAFRTSCPIGAGKKKADAPWWNQKLSESRSKVRRLFNKAKRLGTWQEYTTGLTEYNNEIKKAKRNNLVNFCESISETPEAARLYKVMAKAGNDMHTSLRKGDGSYTQDEEQRAHLLMETHFPGCEVHAGDDMIINKRGNPTAAVWKEVATIFTEERIKWAIHSFQAFKAPGWDGIYPALLQKGVELLLPHLSRIFRSSMALQYIPREWRRAKVIFIPKAGKADATHPKSFRPICLTSFLLKTMEKVVDNYLRLTVLLDEPLHREQHAYRAGRGTETALYRLSDVITTSMEFGETTLCAFLDAEGAFDNTSHNAVENALVKRGVSPTLSKWMRQTLATRIVETQVGKTPLRMKTTRGCPQGGVLSPLMWSLVVDELLIKLSDNGILCQAYADDIVIIARGKYEEALVPIVRQGLLITNEWTKTVGLRLNPGKTTVVPFTRKRKLKYLSTIKVNGVEIDYKKEVFIRWVKVQQQQQHTERQIKEVKTP
ncbi:uncharacterized protein DMENIID0001_057790 [Sergentomyia squamirostris]